MTEAEEKKVISALGEGKKLTHAFPALLRVRDKQSQLIPMTATKIHQKYQEYAGRLSYVVKPRQIWFTTYKIADNYLDCVTKQGHRVLFLNLKDKVTEEVFQRAHTFNRYFQLPEYLPKTTRDTIKKLEWDGERSFTAMTIDNDGTETDADALGRSVTVQSVHITEAARIKHFRVFCGAMLDSIPQDGKVTFETTGAGASGEFYEECMTIHDKGEMIAPGIWKLGEQTLHFIAWWEHPEYTMDNSGVRLDDLNLKERQLLQDDEAVHLEEMRKDKSLDDEFIRKALEWRRWMLVNRKGFLTNPSRALANMNQEYPGNLLHAFQSTGSAYMSLPLLDEKQASAKQFEKKNELPIYLSLHDIGGVITPDLDGDQFLMWMPPYNKEQETWENRYVIGADIGGGQKDSDPDCIFVKDRVLGIYVAVSHGCFGPLEAARRMLLLARFYDRAFIGFELNNHGHSVAIELYKAGYERVYKHSDKNGDYKDLGWINNRKTRDDGVNLLRSNFENPYNGFRMLYNEWFAEARAFKEPEPGKPPRGDGKHDDVVMASVITEIMDEFLGQPEKIELEYIPQPGTVGHMIYQQGQEARPLRNW